MPYFQTTFFKKTVWGYCFDAWLSIPSARTETAMGWAGLSGIGKLSASVRIYSGLTLNQDKATMPQTVQIVQQGEATPCWFKVNPL